MCNKNLTILQYVLDNFSKILKITITILSVKLHESKFPWSTVLFRQIPQNNFSKRIECILIKFKILLCTRLFEECLLWVIDLQYFGCWGSTIALFIHTKSIQQTYLVQTSKNIAWIFWECPFQLRINLLTYCKASSLAEKSTRETWHVLDKCTL